jgi:hypothetical protein
MIPQSIARFLFENSLLDPFWSAWSAGFCAVATDGTIFLTEAGAAYLEEIDA